MPFTTSLATGFLIATAMAGAPHALDVSPPPQKTQPRAGAPGEAAALFQKARKAQKDAAFGEASKLWLEYIDRFPADPGADAAKYGYALSLYHLGRAGDAVPPLRSLIQGTQDHALAMDARILVAECLLSQNKQDEAQAMTFEVIPDLAAEKSSGIARGRSAVGVSEKGGLPTPAQKIRIYTLRGRIFASLGNEPQATAALGTAQKLLTSTRKSQLSRIDRQELRANLAWRRIEALGLSCRRKCPPPQRLSEAEFLAYVDTYYDCASPARALFCDVLAAHDEQIASQALVSYRTLALAPLELRDHLPPPARPVRKREQRGFYEREMKELVEKTVQERVKSYRNLDDCDAQGVF